ncbi:MAG TPA: HEAT repeat domain-containing protein [Chloroflexota bacterium]|nr:HEAT repeat domain-containing protein [Chloroflexota bacterium]
MTVDGRLPPAPPQGKRRLIDQADELAAVAAQLAAAPVLGVDVEAGVPPRERHGRFALLQIAIEGATFAIDPLRIRDLSLLAPIMGSERIVKVFHGIGLDRDMLEGANLPLRQVCDLSELARSAYGKGEASLAALARRAFGIGMDKSLQRSDWLHRPLSLPLLAYAWRDAELTLGLYHWAREQHPTLIRLHTALEPRPIIPEHLPPWLRTVLGGSRQPVADLLALEGLEVERDTTTVLEAMESALLTVSDPRLRARLFRVAGELDLYELVPALLTALGAEPANERAAAAKALATLGEQSTEPAIRALLADETAEVRESAAQALEILPQRIPPEAVPAE